MAPSRRYRCYLLRFHFVPLMHREASSITDASGKCLISDESFGKENEAISLS